MSHINQVGVRRYATSCSSTLLILLANNHIRGIAGVRARSRSLSCLRSYYCLSGLWCSTHTLMKKTTPITVFIRLYGLFLFSYFGPRSELCKRPFFWDVIVIFVQHLSSHPGIYQKNIWKEMNLLQSSFTFWTFALPSDRTFVVKRCSVAYLLMYDINQILKDQSELWDEWQFEKWQYWAGVA